MTSQARRSARLTTVALLLAAVQLAAADDCSCATMASCQSCGSTRVVAAMNAAPTDTTVQANACFVLHWSPIDQVVGASGLTAVISGMKNSGEDGAAAAHCSVALGKLADDGREDASGHSHAAEVAEAGGVALLTEAMVKHADNAEVQSFGAYALASLSKNGQADAVAMAGGAELIVKATQTLPEELGVLVNGCNGERLLELHPHPIFRRFCPIF